MIRIKMNHDLVGLHVVDGEQSEKVVCGDGCTNSEKKETRTLLTCIQRKMANNSWLEMAVMALRTHSRSQRQMEPKETVNNTAMEG